MKKLSQLQITFYLELLINMELLKFLTQLPTFSS